MKTNKLHNCANMMCDNLFFMRLISNQGQIGDKKYLFQVGHPTQRVYLINAESDEMRQEVRFVINKSRDSSFLSGQTH